MTSPYECVDPSVGRDMWRLQLPDLDPSLRSLLEAHASVCAECRQVMRLDGRVQALADEGRLKDPFFRPRRVKRRAALIAALPLAASIAMLVALPPRPITEGGATRGAAGPRFLRPVEGEVVAVGRPVLRWAPIEGATGYAVELHDREGRAVWSGQSKAPEIRLDEGADLPSGHEYRALLSVRPADLAPPAPASVVFRRDSWGRMVWHRARWADPWRQAVAALLLGSAVVAVGWGARRRTEDGVEKTASVR